MNEPRTVPSIDICPTAMAATSTGESVSAAHRSACPVCRRRDLVLRAQLEHWPAVQHPLAERSGPAILHAFLDGRDHTGDLEYRGFFGHLAQCQECESTFAHGVAAERAPQVAAPARPTLQELLKRSGPERTPQSISGLTQVAEWILAAGAKVIAHGRRGDLVTIALSPFVGMRLESQRMGSGEPSQQVPSLTVADVELTVRPSSVPEVVELTLRRRTTTTPALEIRVYRGVELPGEDVSLITAFTMPAGAQELARSFPEAEVLHGRLEVRPALPA